MTPTKKTSISAEPFYCRPYRTLPFLLLFCSGQTADEVEAVSQLEGQVRVVQVLSLPTAAGTAILCRLSSCTLQRSSLPPPENSEALHGQFYNM